MIRAASERSALLGPLLAALIAVGLMIVWAVHDGGYDSDTWYWGALLLLAELAAVMVLLPRRHRLSRATVVALTALSLYVAWSYLSITWADSPGDALQGSNRALLYLLLFTLLIILPWTASGALIALLAFVLGVGVIELVLLLRLAATSHIGSLIADGRLSSPTGYWNATAALFTMDCLAATALASRRELPGLLRGVLIAVACASLQLTLIVQSRGWLVTLPVILIVTVAVVPDRLRFVAAAVIPAVAALAPVHRFLAVYKSAPGLALDHAARQAGHTALLTCAALFVAGTLIAWGEVRLAPRPLSASRRRVLGVTVAVAVIVAACVGGVAATHGHPFRFISRQWKGFSHVNTSYNPATSAGSHFAEVGSGRYDFWRVSLDALRAHPLGGLGQDNFADYYVKHRHTNQEPSWTHSLEMRLLAQTGVMGFALFAIFAVAALIAALRARRHGDPFTSMVAAAALLPFVVWLIHGSVDWFWEMPALSGPALGFLAVAGALGEGTERVLAGRAGSLRARRWTQARPIAPWARSLACGLGVIGAVILLGFPYLSVREVSIATNVFSRNPASALRDLGTAAKLNPLSAVPARTAGMIALQSDQYSVAQQRFRQAISREPGGWFSWLGAGLAASGLGNPSQAHHDFVMAASINSQQPAIRAALARVYGPHPLTGAQALQMLVFE